MINLAQYRSILRRGAGLVTLVMLLLVVGGCNNQQPAAIPTPDLEILAPTATGVTARVEVIVVVVTATSEPTVEPTAEPTAPPEPTAGATEAGGEDAAASPTAASENATAAPTATPETGDTGEQQAADSSGQPAEMSNQQLINRGEEVYSENCASCHQPNGEGTDLYPALNQSGLLESGDPTQAIQIVLYGRGEMPAFEDTLSNQQIASVLSYERNAWQNDSSVVRVAQVRQVRQGGSADTAQAESANAMSESNTAEATAPATDESTADTETSESTTPTAESDIDTDTEADTQTGESTTSEPTADMETGESAPAAEGTPTPAEEGAAAAQPTATPSPAGTPRGQDLLARGQRLYAENCASCHGLNGQGRSAYPALAGSELLTAEDPSEAIRYVLYGHEAMPAFDEVLSNEEIAAILSHERNSWGNNGANVTVEQVNAVQAENQGESAEATTAPSTPAATGTVTGTTTVAATAPTTATGTMAATTVVTETAAATVATPTPLASGTVSATMEAPTVSLTWTPERQVTPLLPTTELTTTVSDDSTTAAGTPTPPTTVTVTVSATGTVTVTVDSTASTAEAGSATPSATEATATPAESAAAGAESASGMSDEELISMGETVYATECASCHQINGEGNSTYPALNGSELLTADDPTAAISIVLNGQGEMPAFNEILSTEEIAAVLSHERNAWDNNASVVTVAQVEEVRGN